MAAALAKQTTRRWIAVYITSSLLLVSLEFIRAWSKNEDVRLNIFVKSRCVTQHSNIMVYNSLHRKHPYHLNGRLIFFVLAQVWLSISFALRNVMLERFVFRWAKALPSSNAVGRLLLESLFTLHDAKMRSLFCRGISPCFCSPARSSHSYHLQFTMLRLGWCGWPSYHCS